MSRAAATESLPILVLACLLGTGRLGNLVVWFENSGDPMDNWTRHVLKEKWVRANAVLTVDLDGDGRLDIVAAAERGTNEVRWWHNEGQPRP